MRDLELKKKKQKNVFSPIKSLEGISLFREYYSGDLREYNSKRAHALVAIEHKTTLGPHQHPSNFDIVHGT